MARAIMLMPIGRGTGITAVSLGLIRAMQMHKLSIYFFKPISQARHGREGMDLTTAILQAQKIVPTLQPCSLPSAEALLGSGSINTLLEAMVAKCAFLKHDPSILLIEGMVPTDQYPYALRVNDEIARTLCAERIAVIAPHSANFEQLKERLEVSQASLPYASTTDLGGIIINRFNAPLCDGEEHEVSLEELSYTEASLIPVIDRAAVQSWFAQKGLQLLGCIPWDARLLAVRIKDIAQHLKSEVLLYGDIDVRRVTSIAFCSRSITGMIEHIKPGALLVTSADRSDIVVTICLAVMSGIEIAGLLLTGQYRIDPAVMRLCEGAFKTGVPVLTLNKHTWQTALMLKKFSLKVSIDDPLRIEQIQHCVAQHMDTGWIASLTRKIAKKTQMTPAVFRHQLFERARQAQKRIILPEGDDLRTIKAAIVCAESGIARPILMGAPDTVQQIARSQQLTLPAEVEILDPEAYRSVYLPFLLLLRQHKGLTELEAIQALQDNVVLATLMLKADQVDGLVSGAVNTTANTIRPAMQLIKVAPGASLISSIFFMLLPENVLIYGDCAINPDPTSSELAEIAIQSAQSAHAFGMEPKVAMISYSTGDSGAGSDVDKVREATELVKKRCPNLLIDGPLQYDAALMPEVAKAKAPNSLVAGVANVFIFPDLNTGNTTYKAVQRAANVVSIGPMLQGMAKPVNDLSRGALVEDIVYTIAITAIQAQQSTITTH